MTKVQVLNAVRGGKDMVPQHHSLIKFLFLVNTLTFPVVPLVLYPQNTV